MSFSGSLLSGTSLSGGQYYGAGLTVTGEWTPYQLFTKNEVGAWYDPSDLTTLYQDAAGTTPVTTPGQVVGLMLDKSRGLTLGAELVTNGDFSNGTTGWSATRATLSASNNELTVTSNSDYGIGASAGFTTVVGKTYKASVKLISCSSTIARIRKTDSATDYAANFVHILNAIQWSPNQTFTGYFTATATTTYIMAVTDLHPSSITIASVSVRELPGNHATQSGATSVRPIYAVEPATGRRNLLTFTEDLSNAVWLVTAASKTTAEKITAAATSNSHLIVQSVSLVNGQQYTYQQVLKYETCRFVSLRLFAGVFPHVCFDLVNGTVAASEAGASGTIANLGNGEYLCTITVTATASGTGNVGVFLQPSATNFGAAWTAVGTESVTIKKAQLETGSTATAYQRVVSQYDVTESGVASRHYLAFDGIDDWLQTSTITPGTDKAQVFAGVRKLSDAAIGAVAEPGGGASGTWTVWAPRNAGTANFGFASRGTAAADAISSSSFAAPMSAVITGIGDIASDASLLRVNGVVAAAPTTDQGSGNYAAAPLYIGRRSGSSFPFNGNFYGLIVRFGANLSAAQISNAERWMGRKTGVTI